MGRRWWKLSPLICLIIACSSAPEPVADEPIEIADCIDDRGQRLLTFCASKDAAELAKRQHTIELGADEDKGAEDFVALPVDGAPVRGERDAPITVHYFADLSCQDCRSVYKRLAAEVDHRPGDLRLVFRHAPIDDDGENAARAAIAAAEQGRFWEFVDALYADDEMAPQEQWSTVAAETGLDVDRWEEDRRHPMVSAVLEHDAIQSESVGVVEAPTFFVNGVRMVGGIALHELDEVIDDEKEHVDAMEEAGLSGADISWRRVLHNYQPVDWEDVDRAHEEMQRELHVAHVAVGDSPQLGAAPEESLVTVVVFADFECAYSAEAAKAWRQLVDRYGDDGLRVVFKRFPLSINDSAESAARASVLAEELGAFWNFHDTFFFDNLTADEAQLEDYLRRFGWAGDDFTDALDADQLGAVIAEDRALGRSVGVEGTPTSFVNGIQLIGAFSADELAPFVEDQLSLATSVAELTGNQGDALYRDLVEANLGN